MEGKRDSENYDIISHPVDGKACRPLHSFDLEFARDNRSHLGMSTDGFDAYSTDSSMYSC
jgi:hypothetical protein